MISLAIGGRLTFNLVRDYFYFFPDGHMIFGVPTEPGQLKEHPTAADFAIFKDVPDALKGTYEVKDGKITIRQGTREPDVEPFSIPKAGDDSVLQIGEPSVVGSVKALPFKDGQKLEGTYTYDGTVGLGTATTAFNVSTLTFKPDGTLKIEQLSGVDTQGDKTGATTHAEASAAGTYKLSGYTLETTIGGKTQKQSAFRWAGEEKESSPGLLGISGRVYSRKDGK